MALHFWDEHRLRCIRNFLGKTMLFKISYIIVVVVLVQSESEVVHSGSVTELLQKPQCTNINKVKTSVLNVKPIAAKKRNCDNVKQ